MPQKIDYNTFCSQLTCRYDYDDGVSHEGIFDAQYFLKEDVSLNCCRNKDYFFINILKTFNKFEILDRILQQYYGDISHDKYVEFTEKYVSMRVTNYGSQEICVDRVVDFVDLYAFLEKENKV